MIWPGLPKLGSAEKIAKIEEEEREVLRKPGKFVVPSGRGGAARS